MAATIDITEVRKLQGWFDESNWPQPTCPACGVGRLAIYEANLKYEAGGNSATRNWQEWDGDPIDIAGTFHGEFRCNRTECADWVSVTGDYGVNPPEDPRQGQYADWFKLRTAHPAIDILPIPENTPDPVKTDLRRAAALTWLDPKSAVAALRESIERIMDDQGVPDETGTPQLRTLHHRIVHYRDNANEKFGKLLLAVKWVGNDGAHSPKPITTKNAVDMADLIGIVIKGLYDPDDHSAALALADRINTKKGLVD